jgi:hypothetical protein
MDLPGWQTLYHELKDRNFEIIAVAEDTGGVKAAGDWITKAKPEYTALIDDQHVVSKLFNLVNVPTGIWIDEKGRLVRPPEVAFIDDKFKAYTHFDSAPYLDGIRDWVANGQKSPFVLSSDEMKKRLTPLGRDQLQAAAEFTLAEYLYKSDKVADAIPHFKEAQRLDPDNWNFKRQAWALGDAKRDYGITNMQDELKKSSKPFYPAPELPELKKKTNQ